MHCSVLRFNTLQLPWLTWDIYYIECNIEIQKYRNIGDARCTAASPADLACILGPAASIINLSASARPASKHTALHYSVALFVFVYFDFCVFVFVFLCIFVCVSVQGQPENTWHQIILHCTAITITL